VWHDPHLDQSRIRLNDPPSELTFFAVMRRLAANAIPDMTAPQTSQPNVRTSAAPWVLDLLPVAKQDGEVTTGVSLP